MANLKVTGKIIDLVDMIYPIGSVYISTQSTNPKNFLGGTGEQIQGRFLLGASATYPNGTTGGAATHTLTIEEMPKHSHTYSETYKNTSNGYGGKFSGSWVSQTDSNTSDTGSGKAHNNMPPYLAVYIWKRIS